jgi:hypothetical protein
MKEFVYKRPKNARDFRIPCEIFEVIGERKIYLKVFVL